MSDIVERLRHQGTFGDTGNCGVPLPGALCRKAADEIEQLRESLEIAKKNAYPKELRDENNRIYYEEPTSS